METAAPAQIDGIEIENEDGEIETRIGVVLGLHWIPRESRQIRLRALEIMDEYTSLFGAYITHFQYEGGPRQPSSWQGSIPPQFRDVANFEPKHGFFALAMQRQKRPLYWNTPYLISIVANEAHPATHEPGVIKCHFPWSWVSDNIEKFVETAARWAGYVEASHGSAGLALLSQGGSENGKTGLQDWKLLRDYPGLEYNNIGTYLSKVRFADGTAPRSSNWLTYLGERNIARLGGRTTVDRLLPPGVEIEGYTGGIMLRAGRKPVFCGPEGPGSVPPLYAAVGKLIKPIRFESYSYGIFNTPQDVDDLAETLRWLRRFD